MLHVPPLAQDAQAAHRGALRERAHRGEVPRGPRAGREGAVPRAGQPPAAPARQATDARLRRHGVLLHQGRPRRRKEVLRRHEGLHARRVARRRGVAPGSAFLDDPRQCAPRAAQDFGHRGQFGEALGGH